jgi:hypothetical protein
VKAGEVHGYQQRSFQPTQGGAPDRAPLFSKACLGDGAYLLVDESAPKAVAALEALLPPSLDLAAGTHRVPALASIV